MSSRTATLISGVLARDFLPFVSSGSTITKSSSSSSSALSAQKRPAWRASTPVRATLQMRLLDARSRVALRKARGKGSVNWCIGKEANLEKMSAT